MIQQVVDMFVSTWQLVWTVDGYSAVIGIVVFVGGSVALIGLVRAEWRDHKAQREANKAAQQRVYDEAQAVATEADERAAGELVVSEMESIAALAWERWPITSDEERVE